MTTTKDSLLNPEQEEAATHVQGPLLVLAGAGSGKTRVVTYRISHLLSLGIPPSEIVALTFTNKAAGEMRERVHQITKQNVLTATFHSLSARILRESIEALGYQKSFTIYDAQDSENLLKACLESLQRGGDKAVLRRTKGAISEAKNNLLGPEDLGHSDRELAPVYDLYQRKLKEYNALDFDDLLYLTVKLIQTTEIGKTYQKRWSYILLDEYQDTNQAQYILSKLLSSSTGNLFAVGDPDQSIYSWRGANIRNILNFEKDFPGAKVITLNQNYRSTSTILEAANALIQRNERPYEKALWSMLGAGDKIGLHRFEDDREEARETVSRIHSYIEEKEIPHHEIAILYRTNAQSRLFEDHLLKKRIPYTIVGGLSFYQRREIKDLLAFLRLLVSPMDFICFARTINLPKRGLGPTALDKLKAFSEEYQLPILTLAKEMAAGRIEKLAPKQMAGLNEYVQIFQHLEHLLLNDAPIHQILTETIIRSRYLEHIKTDEPESFDDRKANLDELVGKACEWEQEEDNPSLISFLEELSLKSSLDEAAEFESRIKLMTIHNSKGLEFTLCCIVGMEEEVFPHTNSRDTPGGLEEERRLCYVAMTRAKHYLHLSSASMRFLWGHFHPMRPSRFLREVPAHFFASNTPESTPTVRTTKITQTPFEGQLFNPGDSVLHPTFGVGRVLKSYSSSFGPTYDVSFSDSERPRTLVARYAKLTPA